MQFDNQAMIVARKLHIVLRVQQDNLLVERERLRWCVAFAEQNLACLQNIGLLDDHVEVDEASQCEVAVCEQSEHRTFVGNYVDAGSSEGINQPAKFSGK